MRKIKNVITCAVVCCILLTGTTVSAKSLSDSFSAYTSYTCTNINTTTNMYTYKKSSIAKTSGYKGKHYVRADMGGSSDSVKGAVADSGRIWSSGNNYASVSYSRKIPESMIAFRSWYFATGYGKYGTKK